jgi:hypothetical protein
MLKPMVWVASGPTAVNVAVIVPAAETTNTCVFAPLGVSVPLNVSVVVFPDGVVGVLLLQAAASTGSAHTKAPVAIRRNICSPEPDDKLVKHRTTISAFGSWH